MSSVNFLDKLLDGIPVNFLPLSDVTNYEQPTKYLVAAKNYSDEFDTPVLTAGKTFILGYTNESEGIYRASKHPVIIFDDFTTANKWVDFDFKVKSSAMKMITSKDNNKFLIKYIYYWLNTLPNELIDGDHKRQWIGNYSNKLIPIPCPDNPQKSLEIQAEIVRILDAMTAHTAELTAELTARRKQYNYYRDKLLSFEDGEVEWLDLDTLAKIKTGQSVNKQMISDNPGEYAVINSGREPLGFIDVWNTDNDPIGITSRGVGVGSITWREGKYFRGNLNYSVTIKNKDKISIRYLYHILQKMQLEIQALCTFDGIPALNASNLKTLEIPVPLLDEQNRIVAILDKFDALTASITEGLPREIELREKQYAYYRDLLLSFPQAQAT